MKDQAVTMESRSAIKIKDEYVHVYPQLLFQRLVTVGMKNGELQTLIKNFVTSILNTTKFILEAATWCSEAVNFTGTSETVHICLRWWRFLVRSFTQINNLILHVLYYIYTSLVFS